MELKIENISKTYPGGVQALKNVTLAISPGIYGLLGPHGAGKSTLLRILATLQQPDRGTIHMGEIDLLNQKDELRRTLGYLPQEFGVYPRVTAASLLDYFAVLKGLSCRNSRRRVVEALLHRTNLWEARSQNLGCYTVGMRQRFGVAVAMLGNPGLLIVDEPTAGMDLTERIRFLNLLNQLGKESIVLLSTNSVEDVSAVCTRLAIINSGQVLLETAPMEAVKELQGKIWRRVIDRRALGCLEQNYAVISTKLVSGRTLVHVYSVKDPGPRFEQAVPDLKDVYFSTIKGYHGTLHHKSRMEVVS